MIVFKMHDEFIYDVTIRFIVRCLELKLLFDFVDVLFVYVEKVKFNFINHNLFLIQQCSVNDIKYLTC